MKNCTRDIKGKEYRVVFFNKKTGWSDVSDTNDPDARIKAFKAQAGTGRWSKCGNKNDVEYRATLISTWGN